MFNFGGSSKIRFDGFYYSEPYEEHFGEVDFLRFYRDGSCIKHWTQSNDIDFIMRSTHPDGQGDSDIDAMKAWAEAADWQVADLHLGAAMSASAAQMAADLQAQLPPRCFCRNLSLTMCLGFISTHLRGDQRASPAGQRVERPLDCVRSSAIWRKHIRRDRALYII